MDSKYSWYLCRHALFNAFQLNEDMDRRSAEAHPIFEHTAENVAFRRARGGRQDSLGASAVGDSQSHAAFDGGSNGLGLAR
jgi:hypothetical protein